MDWKKLLGSLSESVDEELRLRNAYLAAENRILRQQIPGRLQLSDGDRHALAEIGQQLGRKALEEIATVAKPDTILAWHRTFVDQQGTSCAPHKSAGRPRVDQAIEDLVVRMARENRSWGYDRIAGALANLGYTISDQTVGNILKRHGLPPAPERKKTVTWREFIRFHLEVLRATDFFTSDVWGWVGLVISSLLFFIPFGRHEAYGLGRISLRCQQWLRLSLWQSLDVKIYIQGWVRTVKEIERAQLVWFGEGRRPPFCEVTSYAHRERLPQGMAKGVRMPAGHRRPIRDGPLRYRQRLSILRQYNCREAA
jgi:putative transposase